MQLAGDGWPGDAALVVAGQLGVVAEGPGGDASLPVGSPEGFPRQTLAVRPLIVTSWLATLGSASARSRALSCHH